MRYGGRTTRRPHPCQLELVFVVGAYVMQAMVYNAFGVDLDEGMGDGGIPVT